MTEVDLTNPDDFSAELHYALLTEGLRGPALRRLMRQARADAELGRIFETKLSEFRRYLRASRRPTVFNWPLRVWEGFTDNARFTPPKEVFVTLVYVGLVMAGIECFKRATAPSAYAEPSLARDVELGGMPRISPGISPTRMNAINLERIESWMISELERASHSDAWRDAIAKQLSAQIETIDIQEILEARLDEVIQSSEFTQRISEAMDAQLERQFAADDEPVESIVAASPAVNDDNVKSIAPASIVVPDEEVTDRHPTKDAPAQAPPDPGTVTR
jgi:hypothetical protein